MFRRILYSLVILIGLSSSLGFIISGGPWGDMNSIFKRPLFMAGYSPFPLVFDIRNFYDQVFLVKNFSDGSSIRTHINLEYALKKKQSYHLALHYLRFFAFEDIIISRLGLKEYYRSKFCSDNLSLKDLVSIEIEHNYKYIKRDINHSFAERVTRKINCF